MYDQIRQFIWALCLHFSRSTFLVSFTDPNKLLFNVKSLFKFLKYGVSSSETYSFISFLRIEIFFY